MFTFLSTIFVYGYLCILLVSSNQVIKNIKGKRFELSEYQSCVNSKQKDKQWNNSKNNEHHKQTKVWNLQDAGAYSKRSCVCIRHTLYMYAYICIHWVPSIASQKPGRKKVLELHSPRITNQPRSSRLEIKWSKNRSNDYY